MLRTVFGRPVDRHPWISYSLMAAWVIVAVATLTEQNFYYIFGGFKPLAHKWQIATLGLQHGYHGLPLPVHLIFNLLIFINIGPLAEYLLGHARYLAMLVLAGLLFALAHSVPEMEGHGGSGLIWAAAPVAFLGLRYLKKVSSPEAFNQADIRRVRGILVIMWVVVTVFMTAIPYFGGFRGNPLQAFLYGNLFHVSATIAGFVVGGLWWGYVRSRLEALAENNQVLPISTGDRVATVLAWLIPAGCLLLIAGVLTGAIDYV